MCEATPRRGTCASLLAEVASDSRPVADAAAPQSELLHLLGRLSVSTAINKSRAARGDLSTTKNTTVCIIGSELQQN